MRAFIQISVSGMIFGMKTPDGVIAEREVYREDKRTVQQPPVPDVEGAAVELALLFWPFPLCLWPPLLLPPPPDLGCKEQKNMTRHLKTCFCFCDLFNIAKKIYNKKDHQRIKAVNSTSCKVISSIQVVFYLVHFELTSFTLFSLFPSFIWGSSSPSP